MAKKKTSLAEEVLNKRREAQADILYSSPRSSSGSLASDILAERKKRQQEVEQNRLKQNLANRQNYLMEELGAMDMESLFNYNEFGMSDEKREEFSNIISNYRDKYTNLKNITRSISDDDYNTVMSSLDSLSDKFDILSSYESEDAFNQALKYQKDYEDMLSFDTEAGQKELDYLNDISGKIDAIENDVPSFKSEEEYYNAYKRMGCDDESARSLAADDIERANEILAKRQNDISGYLDEAGYGSSRELKDAIAEKEKYLKNAKRLQVAKDMEDTAKNLPEYGMSFDEDEDLNSAFTLKNKSFEEVCNYHYNKVYVSPSSKKKPPGFVGMILTGYPPEINIDGSNLLYKAGTYMTDEEYAAYRAYVLNGDDASAERYLEALEYSLNERQASNYFTEVLKDNRAAEMIFGLESGLDQFSSGMRSLFNTKGDYITPSATQMASQMVRQDVGGSGWGVAYDVATTTSNMLPSILASTVVGYVNPVAGSVVGSALMGSSAAGNAYQEMINEGYNKDQARAYAIMTGVSETCLQYAIGGVAKLGGKMTGKYLESFAKGLNSASARFAIEYGGDMLKEGMEEFLQDVLDPFFKQFATGEDLQLDENYWSDAIYSGLLGMLTAGILNGGEVVNSVSNKVAEVKTINQIREDGNLQNLIDFGKTFDATTSANKIANKVNENTSSVKLANLLHSVNATLSEQTTNAIRDELVRRGMRESDADTISQWLALATQGYKLNKKQINILEKNRIVSGVFRDVVVNQNTTVNQRNNAMRSILGEEEFFNPELNDNAIKESVSNTSEALIGLKQYALEKSMRDMGIRSNFANEEKNSLFAKQSEFAKNSIAANRMDSVHKMAYSKVSAENGIEPTRIVSMDNGKMKLQTKDGSVVDSANTQYKSNDSAFVFEAMKEFKYPTDTANEFVDLIKMSRTDNVDNLLYGMNEAYNVGKAGYALEHYTGGGLINDLTEQQKKTAYNRGRIDASIEAGKKQTIRDNGKGKKIVNKGSVSKEDTSGMTETQKTSYEVAKKVVEDITHNKLEFYESVNVIGKQVFKNDVADFKAGQNAPNGWYDTKTGTIYIDIKAGSSGEGVILFTLAHELTHFISDWSPAKFKKLTDFLMQEYGKNNVPIETLINNQIASAKKNGRTISYDVALEEVVADSMQTMFTDTNLLEKLEKLKAQDKNLFQKIVDFIKDMYAKITKAYEGLDPYSSEAHYVKQMKDSLEKLSDLFAEGLVDAGETFSKTQILPVENMAIDSSTESVAPLDVQLMSERTWTESDYVKDREKTAKKIAKELGVPIEKAYKYIDDINSVARLIADDRVRLDYEPNLDPGATVLKKNSDYKWSVDMSTLCAKRLLFTGTFDAIQKAMPNTVFDSEDIVKLRKMMEDRDYQVACGICYVESTRREIGRITNEFIERYKLAQKTGEPITRLNSDGKEVVLTSDGNTFKADKNYTPTLGELNTTDIDLVKRDHPEVYGAYLAFMNARGQAKPKLLETRAEYKGEILEHFKSSTAVEARNRAGGLRLQSFSDFEVPHLIDMMQITMDMARKGLKSQAYTKVPAFADAFGNTGIKINLSLIAKGSGLDANGNLIFDDVEGINHEEAFRLRDKYSKNVGTILVGKSDEHIIAAMTDPRIDYIIPFHKSSWKESLYEALGLTGYDDYTETQNEKPIDKSRKIKNFDPSEYWDFTKTGDENAQIYLEKCREDGRIPKFPQFSSYPGYWKLLIDFKMYDNDGVGSPQEVVRPEFNEEVNKRILDEYKGGHRSFPVAQDVVDDFVKEYKSEKKFSDRDSLGNTLSENQKKFFEKSLARDKNGNLKVYYHGTTSAGFTVFDNRFSDDKRSLFFTDKIENAQSYSASTDEFAPDKNYSFNELSRIIDTYSGGDTYIQKNDGVFSLYEVEMDDDELKISSSDISDIQRYFIDNYMNRGWDYSANIPVYLRLENPLIVDAHNNNWDEISSDIFSSAEDFSSIEFVKDNGDGMYLLELHPVDESEYTKLYTEEQMLDTFGKYRTQRLMSGKGVGFTSVGSNGKHVPSSTRDYSEYAYNKGYDGVIFNNIIDNGLFGNKGIPSQVAIAFDSSRIKSIYNRNPTSREDIRYSDRDNRYMELAKSPVENRDELDKMVEQTARENGYDSPKLYHGTNQFGFTKIDTSLSDDKLSFFATDSENTAKSYSYDAKRRSINPKADGSNVDYEEEFNKVSDKFNDAMYSAIDAINRIAGVYNYLDYGESTKRIEEILSASQTTDGWADSIEDLVVFNWLYDAYDNAGMDVDEHEAEMDEFFDDYVAPLITIGNAKNEAAKAWNEGDTTNGLYELYANTDNMLTIDALGKNWNNIRIYEFGGKFNEWYKKKHKGYSGDMILSTNTREIAGYASYYGYSGVIIKNVKDDGGRGTETVKPATVYIFFDPNEQIKSADTVTYDDNGNIIPLSERFNKKNPDIRYSNRDENVPSQESNVKKPERNSYNEENARNHALYSERVTDPKTLRYLNKQEENGDVIHTYKSMQIIDGKLYSPMAAKVKGEDGKYHMTPPNTLGVWQQAVEDTSNIKIKNGRGYYTLNKGNGKSLDAAYNPYEHSSNLVLNDQFEEAYQRPNLVTVECIIPKSELTSGYRATYAKDSVGFIDWKSGTVAGQLSDNQRKVYLSRWLKPVRIVPDSEVAQMYKDVLAKDNISVPFNVVTPSLLSELEKAGVPIDYDGSPNYKAHHKDVKMSDRDLSFDSRTLLSNALATTAQNDIERKYIEDYQSKIATINEEQNRLTELRAELKELSFAPGKRDMNRINTLRDEATKIANRINTYDKQLLKLQASKPLEQVVERERLKAQRKAAERSKEVLENYKNRVSTTAIRNKVKKYVDDFRQRLQNPTERKYIPAKLVSGIVDIYDMIDPTGYKQDSKVAEKYRTTKEALADLKLLYDSLKDESYDFSSEFDEEFSTLIADLAEAVGDTPLRDMNREQLEDVYDIIHDISAMITDATKQIGTDEAITNYQAGQELIADMKKIKDLELDTNKLSSFFREWTLNPMRAVKEMSGYRDDARLVKLFNDLNNGRIKADKFKMDTTKKFESIMDGEGRKAFNDAVEKPFDFGIVDVDGNPVMISKMQAMQAILTYRRETANKDRRHLETPVRFTDVRLDVKGKYGQAFDNGHDVLVDDGFVNRVMSRLSEWDMKYLDLASQFFNVDSKNAVNETTIITKHRPLAMEKEYIPYYVNQDYIQKESDNLKFDSTIEGMGMLKAVRNNAPQQLVIRGLNSVIDDHMNKVAKVYGLQIPVRNFNKVFNMIQTREDGGSSVKTEIRKPWGDNGLKLISQAVADLQSNRRNDTSKLLNSVKSAFVTSTLASNISVTMKQAASYPTAGAVLKGSALVKALPFFARPLKSVWEEIDEHTPQHWLRRQGLSSQELGDINQSHGLINKLNNKLGGLSPMNWIQAVDVKTTAVLWIATKYDVESRGFKKGTEEYWSEVEKTYNKVLEDTQPMYDSLHRAEITKGGGFKNIIMFQTQPIQNSGILREGAMQYKMMKKQFGKNSEQAKSSFKKFRSAVESQMASHLVFTMMTLFAASLLHRMNPWRDDDEELTTESVIKEFAKEYGSNFFSAVVPVFGSYAVTAIEKIFDGNGYDVLSDPTVDKINTTIELFNRAKKNHTLNDFISMASDVASYFGIPAGNVRNIINGARLHIEDAKNGKFGSFEAGVERSKKQEVHRSYEAYTSGNMDKFDSIEVEQGSVTSYLKPIFLDAYKRNDTSTMATIRKYMKATNVYKDDIVKVTQAWIKNMNK